MKKTLITIEIETVDDANIADCIQIGQDFMRGGVMVVTANGTESGILSARVTKILKHVSSMLVVQHTQRGFEYVVLPDGSGLQQSSAIGDYEDSCSKPGSSYLWYGPDNDREQLSREDVKARLESDEFDPLLVPHAQAWIKTGSLCLPTSA